MIQPLDPLRFLSLADELANTGGEKRLRTAVGRAYYALFLLSREKTGAFPARRDENSHAMVIKAIRKRLGWTVANKLFELKELRIVADYQLLPDDPIERDWTRNWARTQSLVDSILPHLQRL